MTFPISVNPACANLAIVNLKAHHFKGCLFLYDSIHKKMMMVVQRSCSLYIYTFKTSLEILRLVTRKYESCGQSELVYRIIHSHQYSTDLSVGRMFIK